VPALWDRAGTGRDIHRAVGVYSAQRSTEASSHLIERHGTLIGQAANVRAFNAARVPIVVCLALWGPGRFRALQILRLFAWLVLLLLIVLRHGA
jgi:hypothetical protein